jgi:hypothetical protein
LQRFHSSINIVALPLLLVYFYERIWLLHFNLGNLDRNRVGQEPDERRLFNLDMARAAFFGFTADANN